MSTPAASPGTRPGTLPPVVLFDLDGTLLDSAPDFQATVDGMRADCGLPALPLATLRPHVSRGSRAMLACAFPHLAPSEREAQVPTFLQRYERELGQHGHLFPGIADALAMIEGAGARWGIVTNKPEYLARLLLPLLGWEQRCAILIGGDTLPERKPHPMPLLHAAAELGVAVSDCVYVGDDARDIEAARAAAMRSIAAMWGYRPAHEQPEHWGADILATRPTDLLGSDIWP